MKDKIYKNKLFFSITLCCFTVVFSYGQTATHLVISQVYGGGGNSGATYTNDFIELFNPTPVPINVNGWSVQYASATGSSWSVTLLSGTIAAGTYYLVQEYSGGATGTALPTPDATGTINLSATSGKVALCDTSPALGLNCSSGGPIVDFVGYGTSATCYEGSGAAHAPSNTNGTFRGGSGCIDSDNNAADFTASLAVARNSTFTNSCAVGISAIQKQEFEMRIYPNPTANKLTVEPDSEIGKILKVEIFNMLGEIVNNLSGTFLPSLEHQIIDVSILKDGFYYVQIVTQDKIICTKFYKN